MENIEMTKKEIDNLKQDIKKTSMMVQKLSDDVNTSVGELKTDFKSLRDEFKGLIALLTGENELHKGISYFDKIDVLFDDYKSKENDKQTIRRAIDGYERHGQIWEGMAKDWEDYGQVITKMARLWWAIQIIGGALGITSVAGIIALGDMVIKFIQDKI
jgi:hypothetical protein